MFILNESWDVSVGTVPIAERRKRLPLLEDNSIINRRGTLCMRTVINTGDLLSARRSTEPMCE